MRKLKATSSINVLNQFKIEWAYIMKDIQELTERKAATLTIKTYEKGVVPKVFATLYEHNRGLEVSEHMLTVCQPEEVPEVFELILPPNRTEDMTLLAIDKCAPTYIRDLYEKLSPSKKATPAIVDAVFSKCSDLNSQLILAGERSDY